MPNPLPHHHDNHSEKLLTRMPREEVFRSAADAFKLLSDPRRMQIYWVLCHCEECVMNISALVAMSSPAVSHHLKLLKEAGLITSRRDGKEVYYTAASTEHSADLHETIEKMIRISCPTDPDA